jgi:hypothetical protein
MLTTKEKEKLVDEIISYRLEYLDNLILDQKHQNNFINEYCMNCKNHSIIKYGGIDLHVCNDNWSGQFQVGQHIFYCETRDICTEKEGFKFDVKI